MVHVVSAANHTLNSSHTIRDGETIVSPGGMFQLGFFGLGNPTNRYLGMWFKNITVRTYIWVANRHAPLTTKSGVLRFTEPVGNLALFNHTNGIVVWSTNSSRPVRNPYTQLLNTGNLVVKDAACDYRSDIFLWQSFDYLTDSFLPGMSLGWDYARRVETYLSSWTSLDDPAPGEYSSHLDPTGYPQVLNMRGEVIVKRVGPWNGARFSGSKGTRNGPTLRMNKNEVKYMEENEDPSVATLIKLLPDGVGQRWVWDYRAGSWAIFNLTNEVCDGYNMCGAHASCDNMNSPASYCGCLDKFEPRDPESWERMDWSNGCVRSASLNCEGVTLLEELFVHNLHGVGYTRIGERVFILPWDLVDIRAMAQGGQDLYIRLASTALNSKGIKN
ncbi:hypothetical protein CASFOL_028093 [Castilleja foliolosa]|uniref:Bulb-type lectin domain-containing protein n=1 Tax=Castilleja foliolosa TaxID=1961234 RepID=A0ABD3CF78_9LAMI